MASVPHRIYVIDSHTGGEPTRVVVSGGPELGSGTMADRLHRFRSEYDHFRSAIVNEPRGSDAVVGALLCESTDASCTAGVIFFNNVGYLGMCGHGTIGLGATLAFLGRIAPGLHRVETPVGVVGMELHSDSDVTVWNVPSHRAAKDISVHVEGMGAITGDIAWGGNWFFLTYDNPCALEIGNLEILTDYAWRIRLALRAQGITGEDGQEIDHIEIFGLPHLPEANSRNFVLCPGKSYDRSPCGTGTSAKLACLYADGKLAAGEIWRQESIVGSLFEASVQIADGKILPHIKGSAYISAESHLIIQPRDPFCWGIRA